MGYDCGVGGFRGQQRQDCMNRYLKGELHGRRATIPKDLMAFWESKSSIKRDVEMELEDRSFLLVDAGNSFAIYLKSV